MQETLLKKLEAIVGTENLFEQPAQMAEYLSGPGTPCAVVRPGSTADVAGIIALCNELGVKLCAGGHTVQAQALDGGVAMVLARLDRVLDIDHQNLVVEVEAGLAHARLQDLVAAEGLYFPPEPYKGRGSSIGACIAAGDLDCRAFMYGPPRTYVLGFEMVTPTGEILRCGGKVIKNVAGYDLIHFIVGSRGTLGVITKVLLKLLPLPESRKAILGAFSSVAQAAGVAQKLLDRKIYPARLNLLNAPVAAQLGAAAKGKPAGGLLMVDLEGYRTSVDSLADEISALFKLDGALAVTLLEDEDQITQTWSRWLDLKEASHQDLRPDAIDFLVGPAHVAEALARLHGMLPDLETESGLIVYLLNGNIRIFPSDAAAAPDLVQKVSQLAMALGGNISGDLGFKLKCEATSEEGMWREMVSLTNEIRHQFDPNGILAPGVNQ